MKESVTLYIKGTLINHLVILVDAEISIIINISIGVRVSVRVMN